MKRVETAWICQACSQELNPSPWEEVAACVMWQYGFCDLECAASDRANVEGNLSSYFYIANLDLFIDGDFVRYYLNSETVPSKRTDYITNFEHNYYPERMTKDERKCVCFGSQRSRWCKSPIHDGF